MTDARKLQLTDNECAILQLLYDRADEVELREFPGWSELDDVSRTELQKRLVYELGVAKHYTRGSLVITETGRAFVESLKAQPVAPTQSTSDDATTVGLRLEKQDIAVLRFLRNEVHSGGKTFVRRDELPGWNDMKSDVRGRMMERLFNNRLVQRPIEGSQASVHLDLIEITQTGKKYLLNYENPDYWALCVRWFRTKWWSIPLIILLAVATWILDRFDVLTEVGKWLRDFWGAK